MYPLDTTPVYPVDGVKGGSSTGQDRISRDLDVRYFSTGSGSRFRLLVEISHCVLL